MRPLKPRTKELGLRAARALIPIPHITGKELDSLRLIAIQPRRFKDLRAEANAHSTVPYQLHRRGYVLKRDRRWIITPRGLEVLRVHGKS